MSLPAGLTRWHALLVLPTLFWAGNALVGRATVGTIPPISLSFWRWALALALILPFTWREVVAHRRVFLDHWRAVVGMALTSVAAYNTLLYLALQTTTAINATLVSASLPVMILVLSRLWLAEPIRPPQAAGILVSAAGVLAVVSKGEAARLAGLHLSAGDGLVLAATLSWAVYSVMLRRYRLAVGGLALLTVLIAVGLVAILPLYLWELAQGARIAAGWTPWAAAGYAALFPSLLAYYFWNQGVAAVGAGVAGLYIYLTPLFTAALAVALLDERLRWFHGLGGGLIFGGIWLATVAGRKRV